MTETWPPWWSSRARPAPYTASRPGRRAYADDGTDPPAEVGSRAANDLP